MAQSHSSILVHLIFSTKGREPFLDREIRKDLFQYLAAIGKAEASPTHAIGGVEDHVHLLVTLPRTRTLAAVVETFKTSSSKWLKTKSENLISFAWQQGYGAFSVSHSQMEIVCRYIRSQESHHLKINFRDEMLNFLSKHDIKFNEQYLWR